MERKKKVAREKKNKEMELSSMHRVFLKRISMQKFISLRGEKREKKMFFNWGLNFNELLMRSRAIILLPHFFFSYK